MSNRKLLAGLYLLGASLLGTSYAQESPRHIGVQFCGGAGNGCHALPQRSTQNAVRQDEVGTWESEDPHAGAYEALMNDRSRRIAANLGLRQPAHETPACLVCHSDYGAPVQEKTHEMADGVQCETCHGGAERYLALHLAGDHQANVEAGLKETDNPLVRAELCLSCHLGSGERFISHRMMGAGHPRLRGFELDTFTLLQPAHFDVDADYTARNKQAHPSSTVWAVGQVVAARVFLDGLANHVADGVFPELIFYDCHACHHEMEELRWQPRASHGIGPGLPRLNDSSLLMLELVVAQAWPEQLSEYESALLELHQQTTVGVEQTRAAAKRLLALTEGMSEKLMQRGFSEADVRAVLTALVESGLKGEYLDYAATEQAAMALLSMRAVAEKTGADADAASAVAESIAALKKRVSEHLREPAGESTDDEWVSTLREAFEALTWAE